LPYTVIIPNSKRLRIEGDFSGTELSTEIINQTGLTHPKMSLTSQDKSAEIIFQYDHKVGVSYTMVTSEKCLVVKSYDKPPIKKSISGLQYFRGKNEEGREKFFPVLKFSSCISFDQSYFLRTIGQLNIQEKLGNQFSLFSGAGFGVIQAFAGALDMDISEVMKWFVNDLRNSIHKSILKKTTQLFISFMIDFDGERLNPKPIKKVIRKFFSKNNRDLLVRDCKGDVFIILQDISGRTATVTKGITPNFPIYEVISASIFDPVFFKTRADQIKGFGVMGGDVAKNNNSFIRKNNPSLSIISVGSPVRLFDKGKDLISRSDLSLKISDRKHETDLVVKIKDPYKRHQCKPIDECFQFATDRESMELAFLSGDIDARL